MRQVNAFFQCLDCQYTVVAKVELAEIVQSTDAVHSKELIVSERELEVVVVTNGGLSSLIIVKAFRVEFSPSLSAGTNRCCRFSANHCRPTSGRAPTESLRSWAPSWGLSSRDPERQHLPRSLRKIEQIVGRESRSRRWRTLRDEEWLAIKNAKKNSRNFQLRGSIGSRFHRLQSVTLFTVLRTTFICFTYPFQ